jgi:hypothetical protein
MATEGESIALEMLNEARAMAMHMLRGGIAVPARILELVAQAGALSERRDQTAVEGAMPDISRAHGELARLIEPFTPDLIVMLEIESKVSPLVRAMGRTRIERSFVLTALASISVFIALSLSHYLKDPMYGDFFTSSGFPLLINEFFFISSAAVGASFSNLFQIDRELTAGTFIPKNQSSYWVQFILGIVAGLLLSTILNVQSVTPTTAKGVGRVSFEAATLALMGGFSSSIVQRIVQRIIEALESVLRGSAEQEVQARERANRLRLEETLAKHRMRTTLMLVDMQRRLAGGESPETLLARVEQASRSIISNEELPSDDPAPPVVQAPPATKSAEITPDQLTSSASEPPKSDASLDGDAHEEAVAVLAARLPLELASTQPPTSAAVLPVELTAKLQAPSLSSVPISTSPSIGPRLPESTE